MNNSSVARHPRLVEAAGGVCFLLWLALLLSLVSYHPSDASWNTAASMAHARNLIGPAGAWASDLCYQTFGLLSFGILVFLVWIAWHWVHCRPIETPIARILGSTALLFFSCAAFALGPKWELFGGAVLPGGTVGTVLADFLLREFNYAGALIFTCAALLIALYVATRFRLSHLGFLVAAASFAVRPVTGAWQAWRTWRARPKRSKAPRGKRESLPEQESPAAMAEVVEADMPPWESDAQTAELVEEIPIRPLEDLEPRRSSSPVLVTPAPAEPEKSGPQVLEKAPTAKKQYMLPSTGLLNEIPMRNPFDEEELKQTAGRIKAKFDEFNVFGSVVQINPGPVVTTFEFKPDAGIKYSRITALTEDLCLGLQAESIIIERIPGKPTVGIEVPNTRREVISLRQILESEEFQTLQSRLTIPLGKDVSGRIKVARARDNASPADCGLDGLRQERDAEHADHVAAVQVDAG